ncbi:FecCD family ABC transporter permease [Cryptosporangium japonicum]|uniref:Iron chelate uptake ABC transporter family permease subunit n=1 Tax=Cryptosporangium japonicum TaxID=80872 RepID=A0ABP3DPL7_9ACTN
MSVSLAAGRATYRAGPVSGVLSPRAVLTSTVLAVLAAGLFLLGVATGDLPLPLADIPAALVGAGDPATLFVVQELRLPRALVGLLVGVVFGLSGAVFQTMSRNPLAAPDMIGITGGAQVAVVGGIVLGWGAGLGTQVLGLLGAFAAGALVYVLSMGSGHGYRLVLVGIGVSWACASLTDYLLAKALPYQANQAVGWLFGSLNERGWHHVRPLALAALILVPTTLLLSRWLRTLQLGDAVARGLGTPVGAVRFALLIVGAGLAAFGTAAAGPIIFVALVSPQIAQRLAGTPAPPLVGSALVGAVLVLGADLVTRHVLVSVQLPVGVVTGILGAPVLLWLLTRANRLGSGG